MSRLMQRTLPAILLAASVAAAAAAQTATRPSKEAVFVAVNNRFAFKLYTELAKTRGNIVIGPPSILAAMTILAAGAEGDTRAEIDKVVALPKDCTWIRHALRDLTTSRPAAESQTAVESAPAPASRAAWHRQPESQPEDPSEDAMQDALSMARAARASERPTRRRRPPGPPAVTLANGCWVSDQLHLRPAFQRTLTEDSRAEVRPAAFASDAEGERTKINAWVSGRTNRLIPALFPRAAFQADTMVVLASALHFDASWSVPFTPSATREAPFHGFDGRDVWLPMMAQVRFPMRYAETASAMVAEFIYNEGVWVLDVLMPIGDAAADTSRPPPTTAALAAVEAAHLASLAGWEKLRYAYGDIEFVNTKFPKVRVDSAPPLTAVLHALGVRRAFDPERADLGGMVSEPVGRPFLGDVRHSAVIRFDEGGTEAAAATGLMGSMGVGPRTANDWFVIDRPFAFVIRNSMTGLILFIGRVENPWR